MRSIRPTLLGTCLLVAASGAIAAQTTAPVDPAALGRLSRDAGNRVTIRLHRATGAARFVRVEPGVLALAGARPQDKAGDFLARYGRALGVKRPALELRTVSEVTDPYGRAHVTYDQIHRGVPVFAGRLKLHFDQQGELTAANGTIVPDLTLDTDPAWTAGEAAREALAVVAEGLERTPLAPLTVRTSRLVVFREGLLQGVAGPNHLCWEVEIGNGADVRELVFVDARSGKVVEQITKIFHALDRRVHEPAFDDVVIWSEGDALPYSTGNGVNDGQVNGLIDIAADVYALYGNLSGGDFLSWDGADGTLHTVWKAEELSCPNASWNGLSTNYCNGVASDDVAAHEWTHAYTETTHGLIYQWQPGALNEAYSDMFGEIVDFIDGTGTDTPGGTRSVGDCSTFADDPPPALEVQSPASVAGDYVVAGAAFNPAPPAAATAAVALANSGGSNPSEGCGSFIGFTPGRIALVERGNCPFTTKVTNAQNAGASAVIVANNAENVFEMSGNAPSISIPSVMVRQSDGNAIKAALGAGTVLASVELPAGTANSYRWLMGEDSFSFGGPIRDLWNPNCKGDPAKVSDGFYWCSTGDGGGVHTNSGVPNHAFALLVDGGTFNGHTVAALGMTKAAHIYWRAMTIYQVPATDFADHADALAQSCLDLIGVNLAGLLTGTASGQIISPANCAAVDQAIAAVELTAEPPCAFEPLLDPATPPLACGAVAFSDDFETQPTPSWTRTNSGVFAEYLPRDWEWTDQVPPGGDGYALFALDSLDLGNCIEGDDDQSGVMRIESPPIALGGSPTLVFDHYVATEPEYDGGNLKISVDGGPWELIGHDDFDFNPYNGELADAEGNNPNTNPLAGEPAFTGSDGGQVAGSWGQSRIDLSSYATAGDVIRLRFDFGVDGCNGLIGWYVDDVLVCTDEAGAGSVPDGSAGSTPLTVDIGGSGNLTLTWADSCAAGDGNYAIYEGSLGNFQSHLPVTCTTAGATTRTFHPAPGNTYYLVVPRSSTREGSYGTDSAGAERPASAAACLPQALAPACP